MTELILEQKKKKKKAVEEMFLIEDEKDKIILKKIYDFFKNVPQGMTEFQLKNFVLGDKDFPTIDSKYWQGKLELWVRFQNLFGDHFNYNKSIAKAKFLRAKISEEIWNKTSNENSELEWYQEQCDANIEKYENEVKREEFNQLVIIKTAGERMKEIRALMEVINDLTPKLKHDSEDKESQEPEYWAERIKRDPNPFLDRHPEVVKKLKDEGMLD